jgi:O-antigen ligase
VSIFKNGLGADNYHGQNIVYYIMIFLPFLLCLESDFLKNTYLILMGILVAVSFKTTAMISYAVTLCIFFIWKKDSRGVININGLHIRKVFWFLVAILVLAGILQTIENRTDNYLVTKLNKSFTSGGSGRDVIWERTWNAQKMSNPVQWIFGHGSIIVAQANGLGNSAHNDFLEITFNYGLVGLILYLNIYLMLIKQAWRAYKIKSPMFVPWMASMILFAITSTFSHMITYPQYFPILMCFWGIAMGRPEEDSINNRMERSVHVRNSWDCISKI